MNASLKEDNINSNIYLKDINSSFISKKINNSFISKKINNEKKGSFKNLQELIETKEYRLNSNIFDPAKNSPPNEWELRLQNRLKILNCNTNLEL